jgi:E3 ubiquitin-protein ligase MARCH6
MTEEFLAIWRRADSDPKEVLRIIETENKGDQLRYWVNAMKLLQTPSPASPALPASSPDPPAGTVAGTSTVAPEAPVISFTISENSSTDDLGKQSASDGSSASSESWVEIPKPLALLHHNSTSTEPNSESSRALEYRPLDKGKNRAIEGPEPSLPQNDSSGEENTRPALNPFTPESASNLWTSSESIVSFSSSTSRPRAISDGPQTKESILTNNWNFSNLPDDDNVDYKFSWNKGNDTPAEISRAAPGPASSAQITGPENHIHDSQAWKAAQDLRVQQAIARGREVHKTALADHESASQLQIEKHDAEATTNEKEDSIETPGEFVYRPIILDEAVELSDSDNEIEPDETATPTVLPNDVPLPETREPVLARPADPQGLLANIADFLWGGVGDDRPQ